MMRDVATDGGEPVEEDLTEDDFKQLLAHHRFRLAVGNVRSIGMYFVAASLGLFGAVYGRRGFDIAPETFVGVAMVLGFIGMSIWALGPRVLRSRAGGDV